MRVAGTEKQRDESLAGRKTARNVLSSKGAEQEWERRRWGKWQCVFVRRLGLTDVGSVNGLDSNGINPK